MKNQGISDSILGYISSRNNDINGYWGVGILAKYCVDKKRKSCGVNLTSEKLNNIESFKVSGFIVNDGLLTIRNIIKNNRIEKIKIRLDYRRSEEKNFGYADTYKCNISVVVIGKGSIGISTKSVLCWPHNPSRERRRNID